MNDLNKMKLFDVIEGAHIDYDEHWGNGTGYYDRAVSGKYAPKLEIGEVRKTANGNRKIMLVGTRYGNVIVFMRYAAGYKGTVVANMPREVEKFMSAEDINSNLSLQTMERIMGYSLEHKYCFDNIGVQIEEYHNLIKHA